MMISINHIHMSIAGARIYSEQGYPRIPLAPANINNDLHK